MEKLRKVAALAGGNPKKHLATQADSYSTDTASQRNRILARLQLAPMTTADARSELDIFHPAARIQELREDGHNIFTYWKTIDTGKAKHRVASYVLLVGGDDV